MALAIDASTPANVQTNGAASTTLTTASFTPAANSLLVVIFNSTGGSKAGATSITDSLGTPLVYGTAKATQTGTDGATQVYIADVGASPAAMTVTANFASTQWVGLMVVVVTGAAVKASQNGGTGLNHSSSGTPSCTVSTLVGTNSLIIGGFTNNTNATAPTVPAGQSRTINGIDTWAGDPDCNWCQYLTGMNLSAGASATINDTAPTGIQFSGAILEILAGATSQSKTASTVAETDAAIEPVVSSGGLIALNQIEYHYSGSGTPANPELSLGGAIAAGTITSGAANNVWKDVTDADRQSGKDYYSCVYVKNTHPSDTWRTVTLWITDPEDQGTTSVGLDPAAVGGTATTVANVNTAPTGVTFGQPASKAAGTVIGDIPPGSYKAFWEKRSFPAAGTAAADAISIRCEGDTIAA